QGLAAAPAAPPTHLRRRAHARPPPPPGCVALPSTRRSCRPTPCPTPAVSPAREGLGLGDVCSSAASSPTPPRVTLWGEYPRGECRPFRPVCHYRSRNSFACAVE